LNADAGSSSIIDLWWDDNSNNESGFKIERSPNGTSNWVQIDTVGVDDPIYSDFDLSCNTIYYYRVRAYNAGGDSAYSNTASTSTLFCPPPNSPANLNASAISYDQINLSWNDTSSDESDFHIERSLNGNSDWILIGTIGVNNNTYNDIGLFCNTVYYYRVRAHRHSDNIYSNYSNVSSSTTLSCPAPNSPTNLIASALSYDQINLSWNDTSSDESDFHIERSPNGISGWAFIDTIAANNTTYNDLDLSCNTVYYYRVRAHRHSDNIYSNYSNVSNSTTMDCNSPNPPDGISASKGTYTNKVQIIWNNSSGAIYYEVWRASSLGGTKYLLYSPLFTFYDDTSINIGSLYYYWIKACNSFGCSNFSIYDIGFAIYQVSYSVYLPIISLNHSSLTSIQLQK
jgi:fibronectin type 3 domain-containing protein